MSDSSRAALPRPVGSLELAPLAFSLAAPPRPVDRLELTPLNLSRALPSRRLRAETAANVTSAPPAARQQAARATTAAD